MGDNFVIPGKRNPHRIFTLSRHTAGQCGFFIRRAVKPLPPSEPAQMPANRALLPLIQVVNTRLTARIWTERQAVIQRKACYCAATCSQFLIESAMNKTRNLTERGETLYLSVADTDTLVRCAGSSAKSRQKAAQGYRAVTSAGDQEITCQHHGKMFDGSISELNPFLQQQSGIKQSAIWQKLTWTAGVQHTQLSPE